MGDSERMDEDERNEQANRESRKAERRRGEPPLNQSKGGTKEGNGFPSKRNKTRDGPKD
jgi:hypothetical protein